MKSQREETFWSVVIYLSFVAFVLFAWTTTSYFEAREFNKRTGKSVTTWTAMFVKLRIDGSAND